MDETLQELGEHISTALEDEVTGYQIAFGELTIQADVDAIVRVIRFLRDDASCRFSNLIDICGVDYPTRENRFDVVYHLQSLHQNQRVRVKVQANEETIVNSITELFPSANWFEREVFDMYGVLFKDHPDLRRILTDYGFAGHPLRKDFPLSGFVEVRYDEDQKRVVYEPVNLPQEFRSFDFLSPWEGAKYILPGDEKAEG
ncbi:MAG: NADH-quinone oxidoreductase subunit C [Alphaproteobacteria bacterium]|nr:MAG: NADH-quinone oxidoreductase subunit C [Alphaproteobacteria bacterium]